MVKQRLKREAVTERRGSRKCRQEVGYSNKGSKDLGEPSGPSVDDIKKMYSEEEFFPYELKNFLI